MAAIVCSTLQLPREPLSLSGWRLGEPPGLGEAWRSCDPDRSPDLPRLELLTSPADLPCARVPPTPGGASP